MNNGNHTMNCWWSRRTAVRRLLLVACLFSASCCVGCTSFSSRRNEVIVMGMIHSEHKTSERYGIETVKDYIRKINPDYVLCEIPPDRLDLAFSEFQNTGFVTEPRVRVFPEYVYGLFPLTKEMDFTIVPCAGWTSEMAQSRRTKLKRWETTRPDDMKEVEQAEQAADKEINEKGLGDNPEGIHSDAYDEIVKRGLEPYNRLFNEDLGAGGWDHINAAHYAHIESTIDKHKGEGKRFLIMFGAWHKYWILEHLRKRNDITLRKPQDFLSK